MKHLRLIFAAAVALICLAVIFGAGRLGANHRPAQSPQKAVSYRQDGVSERARRSGVSTEPRRKADQLAHRHIALRFLIDGTELPADMNLGLPDGPEGSLAIHAHDKSSVVHLHQVRGDGPYRFGDLWAVYGLSPAQLDRDGFNVALWVNGKRQPLKLDWALRDRQDIVVEAVSESSTRQLSTSVPLERFSWKNAPLSAR